MSTQHTPGPWVLADENNQCCSVLLGSANNLTCSLDRQDGNTGKYVIERAEMLANARLISAAPDLLGACKDALGCLLILQKKYPELWEVNTYKWDAEKLAEILGAAIAKATGEQV